MFLGVVAVWEGDVWYPLIGIGFFFFMHKGGAFFGNQGQGEKSCLSSSSGDTSFKRILIQQHMRD
jgi:hypothetical protein